MNINRYTDTPATANLIGCIIRNPLLLEQDGTYFFNDNDFVDEFHKILFGAIYNLYQTGAEKITPKIIEDYLQAKPNSLEKYKKKDGAKWIIEAGETAELSNFPYYYDRVKKMTLLREFAKAGIDVSDIYPDSLSPDVLEKADKRLDEMTLQEIADEVEIKFEHVRNIYVEDSQSEDSTAIGDVVDNILEQLSIQPDMGLPLYDDILNNIVRGARKGKLYLRSAATGVGKTRSMIADACTLACNELYVDGSWIPNGNQQPTLYIATEQDIQEITTMCLAFIADVNESTILKGIMTIEEKGRVEYAVQVLRTAPLYIVELPDFNVKDIENAIKKNLRLHKTQYIFFDYVHSSPKILEETTRRSGGVKLREDTILFMFATALKNLCVEYNVFILTSTQLNGNWKTDDIPDQNLLRGAKAIADKVDFGSILLDATQEDIEAMQSILYQRGYTGQNQNETLVKLSIYKNRSGDINKCYLWMKADKGTCRFKGLVVTDYFYKVLQVQPADIRVGEFV